MIKFAINMSDILCITTITLQSNHKATTEGCEKAVQVFFANRGCYFMSASKFMVNLDSDIKKKSKYAKKNDIMLKRL